MSLSKKPAADADADTDTSKAEAEDPTNAVDLLKKDHRAVSALFEQFEGAEADEEKVALAQQICTELTLHAEVEERLFYPAARRVLDEESEDLIDEAAVEHRSLKMLIAEINGSSAGDKLFDANVTVLKEYVQHHVKEEENEMFPKLKSTELDLDSLGAKMAELKEELKAKVAEAKPPRAGAKATVHVPDLSEPDDSTSKSKSSGSDSKSTASKSTASKSTASKSTAVKSPAAKSPAAKAHKAKSSGNGARAGSRSASHSAHR